MAIQASARSGAAKISHDRVEALRAAAARPALGQLLTKTELAKELKCSERRAEMLMESGEIWSFKDGKRRKTTTGAKDDYVRNLIAAEIERLEALER